MNFKKSIPILFIILLILFDNKTNATKCISPCFLRLECSDDTDCITCFCPIEFKCPVIQDCNASCGISIGIINNKLCQKCRC